MVSLKFHSLLQIISIFIVSLFIASCSGEDGGGSGGETRTLVTGVAQADRIKDGTVEVYGYTNGTTTSAAIASTQTDGSGTYSVSIPEGYDAYKFVITSGDYRDEATGETKTITASNSLSSVIPSDGTQVAITQLSDITTKTLEKLNDFNADTIVKTEAAVSNLLAAVMEDSNGSTTVSITGTLPADVNGGGDTSDTAANTYAAITDAFSKLQNKTQYNTFADISNKFAEGLAAIVVATTTADAQVTSEFEGLTDTLQVALRESIVEFASTATGRAAIPTNVDDETIVELEKLINEVAEYVSGTQYTVGDKVSVDGNKYECKPWPASPWCSQDAFKPGEIFWESAWNLIGTGTATTETNSTVTTWVKGTAYKAGDLVSNSEGKIYRCKPWPYVAWCSTREVGVSLGWEEAWVLSLVNHGTDITVDPEQEEENQQTVELIKASISIRNNNKNYNIIISARYSEEYNNRPDGYTLYADDVVVTTAAWGNDDELIATYNSIKDENVRKYHVVTYKNVVQEGGIQKVLSAPSNYVSSQAFTESEEGETDTELAQDMLVVSKFSYKNATIGEASERISVTGGNGDGELLIESSDENVATIEYVGMGSAKDVLAAFVINAVSSGSAKIVVEKLGDGVYTKSNTVHIPVSVKTNETTTTVTQNKPGVPIIAWYKANVEYGDTPSIEWNLYWGQKASVVNLYVDDDLITSKTLTVDESYGAQSGYFDLPISSVTTTVQHDFYVELCNDTKCSVSSDKSISYLAKGSTGDNNGGDDSTDSTTLDPLPPEPDPAPEGTVLLSMLNPAAPVPLYFQNHDTQLTAYFGQWKIYGRDYQIADIPANKISAINYGFIDVNADGTVSSLDKYADFDKKFSDTGAHYVPSSYVYADYNSRTTTVGYINKDTFKLVPNLNFVMSGYEAGKFAGNIKEMMLLKVKYPHLKVLPSFGGWTKSDHIYAVAADPAKRRAFAQASVDFVRMYGFDGIDIDWEFPVRGGEDPSLASPDDRENFTLLMQALRDAIEADSQIGQISSYYPEIVYSIDHPSGIIHPNYINNKLELTIAVYQGVEEQDRAGVDYEAIKNLVDITNVMSYDYHGSWEAGWGKTGHQAPLFNNNDYINPYLNIDSSFTKIRKNHSYDTSVADVINPKNIAVGLAFYGRIAADVSSDENNGYGQSFESTIQGNWEKGNADYYYIENTWVNKNGYTRYWDEIAKVPYLYNASKKVFVGYDDMLSIALKASYFAKQDTNLMFWELSGDTNKEVELVVGNAKYMVPDAGDLLSAINLGILQKDTFYDEHKDKTTFAEVNYTDEELQQVEQQQLESEIDALYAQILGFGTSTAYTALVANASSITFTLDFSAVASEISVVQAKFDAPATKTITLRAELKTSLDTVNTLFYTQKQAYENAYSKYIAEQEATAELQRREQDYVAIYEGLTISIPYFESSFATRVSTILTKTVFTTAYATPSITAVISSQTAKIDNFKTKVISETDAYSEDLADIDKDAYSNANYENVVLLANNFSNFKSSKGSELTTIANNAIVLINNLLNQTTTEVVDTLEDEDITDTEPTFVTSGYSNTILNQLFDVTITKPSAYAAKIQLTYKSSNSTNMRNAKIIFSGNEQFLSSNVIVEGVSWSNPTETAKYDTTLGTYVTTISFDTFTEDDWIDTTFEGTGSTIAISLNPSVAFEISDIVMLEFVPGASNTVVEPEGEAMPIPQNPTDLKVKGWPSYLAMGTVTDNDYSLNKEFADSKVDSVFKYEGDGFGDRGEVIEPIVTGQTIRQAREIEVLEGKKVMPTLVVYSANGSGGGVAQNDILVNYAVGNSNNDNTDLAQANVTKHFQNMIRMAANMQANKDDEHPYPASVVLNADLFGEWQKSMLNGEFQKYFCGGSGDLECANPTSIQVKESLQKAIELESDYMVQKYDADTSNLDKSVDVGVLSDVYDGNSYDSLTAIGSEIDSNISNDIKGWVQSQNLIFAKFAPDVAFGWVINLWNPGSAHWVHEEYAGNRAVWNAASKSVALFTKWIGAYDDNGYKPDFLAFDKYERDGFGAAGKPSYAFSSRAWNNYLTYVKQITDFIDTPAMLWQIPGGHMATKGEDESTLCTEGQSFGCFQHLDTATKGGHSASGGSYFMGDKLIGTNTSNIRDDVLSIAISGSHYNGATNVEELLAQDSTHNWGVPQLRQAVAANAFAILWGGGETTGTVPISTNQTGGYDWLQKKVVAYETGGKIPLYYNSTGTNAASSITSITDLNMELEGAQDVMNNEVLLFDTGTGFQPSSIYKWQDFLVGLSAMHNTGIAGDTYWLFDNTDGNSNTATAEQKSNYAKVAIAAFLAQSMQETIQYDACDENSWQFAKDANTSEAVKNSMNRGDFIVDLPMDAACGQLGQNYGNYGNVDGVDNPYSCAPNPKMEVTAVTNARYYGAAGPIFAAPDSVLEELGLLVDGKAGRWEWGGHCNGTPAIESNFADPTNEGWLREECLIYKGQKAGSYVWDGSSQRSLEGCGWWGRGVIQTTGRENFGKLNHYVGRSHVDKDLIGTKVAWAGTQIMVDAPPENPLYANMDLCANPELICSNTQQPEIKWIAGLFFWMNSVQEYHNNAPDAYKDWNYVTELKKYVDSGFGATNYNPVNGTSFIDAVSGIVNRGCPDDHCPTSGEVHAAKERKENFIKVLKALGVSDPL